MSWRLFIFGLCFVSHLAWAATDSFEGFISAGENHFRLGQFHLALADLQSAQKLAITPEQTAQINGMLGLAYSQMSDCTEKPDDSLRKAIDSGLGSIQDRVHWLVAYAELLVGQGKIAEARNHYARAVKLADKNQGLSIYILLSQAYLFPPDQQLAKFQRIYDNLDNSIDPAERAGNLIDLGFQAMQLPNETGLKLAFESFAQARRMTEGQQPRLFAESLNGLAQLYEDQGRDDEALRLTHQALQSVKNTEARDLLLDLEWRQGRLFLIKQQKPEALIAYQHAVEHLEAIRQDIPVKYNKGHSSFLEKLGPVYLKLADLLLAQASQLQDGERKTGILRHTRETVELLKQAELEDFLGGRCGVYSNKSELDKMDKEEATTTAILYPILLEERLELLVSIGNEIKQYTQPVNAATLKDLTIELVGDLRKNSQQKDGKLSAKDLYDWLIAPIEPWLHERGIKTLVMVR